MFPADRGSVYHREGAFKEAKVLILAGLTARWNRRRTRRSEEPLRRRFPYDEADFAQRVASVMNATHYRHGRRAGAGFGTHEELLRDTRFQEVYESQTKRRRRL